MENNTQARKWALVINNPLEAGLDHAAIREILYRFSPTYFCGVVPCKCSRKIPQNLLN